MNFESYISTHSGLQEFKTIAEQHAISDNLAQLSEGNESFNCWPSTSGFLCLSLPLPAVSLKVMSSTINNTHTD